MVNGKRYLMPWRNLGQRNYHQVLIPLKVTLYHLQMINDLFKLTFPLPFFLIFLKRGKIRSKSAEWKKTAGSKALVKGINCRHERQIYRDLHTSHPKIGLFDFDVLGVITKACTTHENIPMRKQLIYLPFARL